MDNVNSLVDTVLNGEGFVLLPNVLSPTEVAEARSQVLQLAAVERQAGTLSLQGQRERLYGLVFKGEIFEYIVQHPRILAVAEALLGEDMIVGDFSAHIVGKEVPNMGSHVDYPYWSMQPPFPANPVLAIQTIWMMEDFTEINGATVIAPGTQQLGTPPESLKFPTLAKKITGQAGSVLLFHGLCWHDTSTNFTDRPRVSILSSYHPKFIQPFQDPLREAKQSVLDRASPKLQQLLGLHLRTALAQDFNKRVQY